MIERPEVDKLIDYVKARGKSGERTIKILGKNLKFLSAFNTEIGTEVLSDVVSMHSQAAEEIIVKGETPELRAKIIVLNELINKWSDKINAYQEALKRVVESK